MVFDFTASLSNAAQGESSPYAGYPQHHFVGGNIDEPSVPNEALAEAAKKVLLDEGQTMAKYGLNSGAQGYLPLREFICTCLDRRASMKVEPSEVLVTSGSLQAMDLVNSLLLNAGDLVLVEGGNYAGALSRFRALGVEYIGIDLDEHGMRMDHLEEVLLKLRNEGRRAKFIYTIPTIQNPTGTVMPLNRRLEMLEIAKRFDLPIFEDDCYADLVFSNERPPAISALDKEGRVIYCGTFSKTIAPALRVGYLVAPWPVMGRLLALKTDAGSGALEQMTLAEYLPDHYEAHLREILPVLERKAQNLCDALDENFGASADYDAPTGGIYLWVTLPRDVNTDRLFHKALEKGVEINPGSQWTVDGPSNTHRMRICFGHASEENMREGIAKLAQICFEEFGVPVRSGNIDRS